MPLEGIVDNAVVQLGQLLEENPAFRILVGLIVADIVTGTAASIIKKELSSSASMAGMTRKLMVMLMVAICKFIEPIAQGVPLGSLAALFYCGTELLSITENLGKIGVPIPAFIKNTLAKLRENGDEMMVKVPEQTMRVKKPPSDWVEVHPPPKQAGDSEGASQPSRPGQQAYKPPANVERHRKDST